MTDNVDGRSYFVLTIPGKGQSKLTMIILRRSRKCCREITIFTDATEAFCAKFIQAAERSGVFDIAVEHGANLSPIAINPEVKKRIAKQILIAITCDPDKLIDTSYAATSCTNFKKPDTLTRLAATGTSRTPCFRGDEFPHPARYTRFLSH